MNTIAERHARDHRTAADQRRVLSTPDELANRARDESGKALLKSGTASAVVCHVLMLLTLLVTPERVISAAIKNGVELPEHLSIVPAPLDRIESALRSQ
jgi:hypothetical protein